jgi:hypothetical protein
MYLSASQKARSKASPVLRPPILIDLATTLRAECRSAEAPAKLRVQVAIYGRAIRHAFRSAGNQGSG